MARALELRSMGWTFRAIAEAFHATCEHMVAKLGYSDITQRTEFD